MNGYFSGRTRHFLFVLPVFLLYASGLLGQQRDMDTLPFFRTDTAFLQGYWEGYSSDLGFTTGMVALSNLLTDVDTPVVVTFHPDGHFEGKFELRHPQALQLQAGGVYLDFYVEPGDTLAMYVDQAEVERYRNQPDWQQPVRGIRYQGPSADICRKLAEMERFFTPLPVVEARTTMTPRQFLDVAEPMLPLWMYRADSLIRANHCSSWEARLLKNKVWIRYATDLLDFVLYRRWLRSAEGPASAAQQVNEDSTYYDFLKQMPLDDCTLMADEGFEAFISRFQFMPLINARMAWDGSPEEYVQLLVARLRQQTGTLQRLLGSEQIPLMLQMSWVRQLDFDLGTIRDQALARQYMDSLQSFLSVPILRQESEHVFARRYGASSQSWALPEGPGKEVIDRIASKHKGKYVLIDFWGIFCGPCRAAIEEYEWLREKFRGHKDLALVFVTSETDSPSPRYEQYVQQHLQGEEVYRISEADANQLHALFGFNALPHYETLDRQGNVLEESLRYETLQVRFEELLLREKDARLHPALVQ